MTTPASEGTANTKPEVLRRIEKLGAALTRDRECDAHAIDPLAAALVDLAHHHGVRADADVIRHGVPLERGCLAVDHAVAAAARIGLDASVEQMALSAVTPAQLPVIVLIADGSADVVWDIERDAANRPIRVEVSEPGRPSHKVRMRFDEYAAAALGRVIIARPKGVSDARLDAVLPAARTNWFFDAFRGTRHVYGEAIVATLAINVLALAMPLFTMNIYDRVLPNAAAETLWALSIGVILAILFDLLIKTLRARFVDSAGSRADVMLGNFVFGRLLGGRLGSTSSIGVRANTLREFETLREMFNSATLTAFGDLPFLVIFLAMIAVVAGPLVLVPLLACPLVLAIAWWTQKRVAALTDAHVRHTAQKNAVAVEVIAGLESIKAARAESWAASRWERALAESIRNGRDMRDMSGFGMNVVNAVQSVTQIVMIIVGFYMVGRGQLTTGALIAATMLAGRALQPLGQIAALVARLHQARIAYRLVDEIVSAPQDRPAQAQLIVPDSIEGAVTVDAVSVSFAPDAPPALRDLSIEVSTGERIAILGGVGSGKTSLLRLVQALMLPSSGRVLLDGLPVAQIEPSILRSAVAFAMPDAEVFHGTLRENITLGDPSVSDAAVIRAASISTAIDWITRLPKGFDTVCSERGAGLSSGQKQTLTLARALVGQPRVLLLDEPTAHLDHATEMRVVAGLKASSAGRTLIVVTHRPALLDLVDRIIVLDGGRKILDGPKASVLASMRTMAERAAQPARVAPVPAGGAKA